MTADGAAPRARPLDVPFGLSVVVHGGTLGDFVLTLPLLRALAVHGPVWAVTAWSPARLAARRVAGVVAVDGDQPRWSRLYGPQPPADAELAERLAAAVRIVSFVAGPDDPWAANVAALAPRARLAFVPPRPPDGWSAHATAWFDARLAAYGLPTVGDAARAVVDGAVQEGRPRASRAVPDDARSASPPADGPIVLHPGSGAAAKCWPAARFWALAERLGDAGLPVQVVLGEAERARWHEADIRRWRARFDVRLPDSLAALEATLDGARAYVGNDSGPTHLAAQLGVAVVALFGPTSPTVWHPIGPSVTVLAPPAPAAMGWLEVEPVVAAVVAANARAVDGTADATARPTSDGPVDRRAEAPRGDAASASAQRRPQ